MAFTLEATLVIPLSLAITIGVISESVKLYDKIQIDARMESNSVYYPLKNKELWSCRILDKNGNSEWTEMIAVNPVKEKMIIDFTIDTCSNIKDLIPVFKNMEDIFKKSSNSNVPNNKNTPNSTNKYNKSNVSK